MSKKLLAASIGSLIFLIIGTSLYPDNPLFWLATSSLNFQIIRFGLLLILLLQFVTEPPRKRVFRAISAMVAVSVASWTLQATYANHMMLLDALCFLGTSVAVGLVALERQLLPTKSTRKTVAA